VHPTVRGTRRLLQACRDRASGRGLICIPTAGSRGSRHSRLGVARSILGLDPLKLRQIERRRLDVSPAVAEVKYLASEAGALTMGPDAAETIQAANSLEKMLAHQMAAGRGQRNVEARSAVDRGDQATSGDDCRDAGVAQADARPGRGAATCAEAGEVGPATSPSAGRWRRRQKLFEGGASERASLAL
jgi:hypothetical protein